MVARSDRIKLKGMGSGGRQDIDRSRFAVRVRRLHVLPALNIRNNLKLGKMRMDQRGVSGIAGVQMEQRGGKRGHNQRSHGIPRDHSSHRAILTK